MTTTETMALRNRSNVPHTNGFIKGRCGYRSQAEAQQHSGKKETEKTSQVSSENVPTNAKGWTVATNQNTKQTVG
jgi:hypothetical protein